jgi:hypothetical protein
MSGGVGGGPGDPALLPDFHEPLRRYLVDDGLALADAGAEAEAEAPASAPGDAVAVALALALAEALGDGLAGFGS